MVEKHEAAQVQNDSNVVEEENIASYLSFFSASENGRNIKIQTLHSTHSFTQYEPKVMVLAPG